MNAVVGNEASRKPESKREAMAVCCVLGLGSLVAWNSIMTIGDYYYRVFPDYHPSRVLTLVYQPFALGTIILLASYESKLNTRLRNILGYSLYSISTLLLILIDVATSGQGGIVPYIGVCIFVAAFGVADALVLGGMIGDLSLTSDELIQSYMVGLALAGALTSALRLATKAVFETCPNGLRNGAMFFLALSTCIQLLCIILYAYVFPRLPIVRYYRAKAASEGSKTVEADLVAGGIQKEHLSEVEEESKSQRLSNKALLIQKIDHAANLFLVYLLTLSIFPGFLYEDAGEHGLGSWYPLILVAMYNVWDLVSRYIPLAESLKMESRKWITATVLARFLLVPAFYFVAKYGDLGWMLLLTSFLGLTNGYLTVCIFASAPKGYKGPEQNALGNLLVLFLLGGICAGVSLDWLWLIGKRKGF